MSDAEQQAQARKDVAIAQSEDTGDVQVEDAHPQIPKTEASQVPEVKHNEASEAPASNAAETTEEEKKKSYPGGERFDPTTLPKSDDAAEIRKQVEFYFSDSNLTTDKFLYTMVSENEGWADLRSIANFKRMRRFQPFTAVVAALRESKELEVDEKGERVRRVNELRPFSAVNGPVARSVYVKGFAEETKTLQIDLEKYFEGFGTIKVVRLRRTDEGLFKGSVFAEFATLEEQSAFLEKAAGEQKLTYEGQTLEAMAKKAYLDMKEQQYGGNFPKSNGKKSFNAFSKENQKGRAAGGNNTRGGRGRGRGRGGSRGRGGDRNAERRQAADAGEDGESQEKRGEKRPAEDAPSDETTAKVAKTDE